MFPDGCNVLEANYARASRLKGVFGVDRNSTQCSNSAKYSNTLQYLEKYE